MTNASEMTLNDRINDSTANLGCDSSGKRAMSNGSPFLNSFFITQFLLVEKP